MNKDTILLLGGAIYTEQILVCENQISLDGSYPWSSQLH